MRIAKYSSSVIMVPIERVQKHEVIIICGERPLDKFLEKELERYNIIRPIAVEDKEAGIYYVVRHAYLLDLANNYGEEKIELIVVECPIGEAPRLYNYEVPLTAKRSNVDTFKSMEYMDRYLTDTIEGKQFCHDLPGSQKRDKNAYLHGYRSGSMVTKYLTIGRYAPHLLEKMDEEDSDIKIQEAYERATAIKKEIDGENAAKASLAEPRKTGEVPPTESATIWSSNNTRQEQQLTSTSTETPSFEQSTLSETPPEFDATTIQETSFAVPTTTPAPLFFKPSLRVVLENGKMLDADFSSHEIKVAVDGIIQEGFTYRIHENDREKTLQLICKGAHAVTIAYNKQIFN